MASQLRDDVSRFGFHLSDEPTGLRVDPGGEREVLPHQESPSRARLVELGEFDVATSPHPDHVEPRLTRLADQAADALAIYATVDRVGRLPVRPDDRYRATVHHKHVRVDIDLLRGVGGKMRPRPFIATVEGGDRTIGYSDPVVYAATFWGTGSNLDCANPEGDLLCSQHRALAKQHDRTLVEVLTSLAVGPPQRRVLDPKGDSYASGVGIRCRDRRSALDVTRTTPRDEAHLRAVRGPFDFDVDDHLGVAVRVR